MRNMIWIYAVVIFLLSEAWSTDTGTNQTTPTNATTVYVVRHETFFPGSEVQLTCSNKTWDTMLFVVWKIKLKDKNDCMIAFKNGGESDDSCNDGKSLRNKSNALSYLNIPNISDTDEGLYKCESVYSGGVNHYAINVAIVVSPSISAWLDHKDNKMFAVCKAERGKPAANISWSNMGNASSVETGSDGFFTVESRLELVEGMDIENLSCAIRHPNWKGEKFLVPKHEKGYFPWLYVLIVVVIIVLLAGISFFAIKKIITLRQCQQRCQTSPSKYPPAEDVEEVEPYASYVQRVNSIYNSSIDLFR